MTRLTVIILAISLLLSCDAKPPAEDAGTAPGSTLKAAPSYRESGDLNALREHGQLRLLTPEWEDTGLPREGLPTHGYRELAEEFTRSLGLQVLWVHTENFGQLVNKLESGEGDLIVANLTQTPERDQRIAFSLPISSAQEHIVSAKNNPIEQISQLQGKRIVVGSGSSFAESLRRFSEKHPELGLILSEHQQGNPDVLLDLVNQGAFDAMVMDSNVAESMAEYRNDFAIGLSISPKRPIGWAVRNNNPNLLRTLNAYLTEAHLVGDRNARYTGDFDAIKQRKTLRIITRNSPASYFLWRGELMGYEYDLMKKFADRQGLRLEIQVAPPGTDMIAMLLRGEGDVIAAGMTITPQRQARGVVFSQPYNTISEQLVTHAGAEALDSLEALSGRTLTIRKDHAYWQTAKKLLAQGYDFDLQEADPETSVTDILTAVAAGKLDATIADSHLVGIESKFSENLRPGLELQPESKIAWAVRNNNPKLLEKLNHYVQLHYRGRFFNVTYNKYFRNERRIDKYQGQRLNSAEQLSPYDDIIKPLAEQYHFDWRLLVSQMYQESKFNPNARSHMGARGLMQVIPRTAREFGVKIPFTPETSIYAGVLYLDWTRDRFEATLPLEERMWFALAAYNAGFGHVNDARRLARLQGWSGDQWFDNVERAMLLLAKRKYYSKARFGYVRGSEPVNYVRQIRKRYLAYLAL